MRHMACFRQQHTPSTNPFVISVLVSSASLSNGSNGSNSEWKFEGKHDSRAANSARNSESRPHEQLQ